MNLTDDLGFVADVAVGQEGHEPEPSRVGREAKRGPDALVHLRTAVRVQASDIAFRSCEVVARRRHRVPAKLTGIRGEADDLEGIGRFEEIERLDNGLLGLPDRCALHRSGAVDHEDHLHGMPVQVFEIARRIKHHREVSLAFLAIHVGQKIRLDPLSRYLEIENKISVGDCRLIGELDACGTGPRAGLIDFVARPQGLDGDAGVELDRDADVVPRTLLGP